MELQPSPAGEQAAPPAALRGLLFLVLLALFLTGLWLLGEGVTQESAALFVLGIVGSGLPFTISMSLRA